jgi:hypothetical protein
MDGAVREESWKQPTNLTQPPPHPPPRPPDKPPVQLRVLGQLLRVHPVADHLLVLFILRQVAHPAGAEVEDHRFGGDALAVELRHLRDEAVVDVADLLGGWGWGMGGLVVGVVLNVTCQHHPTAPCTRRHVGLLSHRNGLCIADKPAAHDTRGSAHQAREGVKVPVRRGVELLPLLRGEDLARDAARRRGARPGRTAWPGGGGGGGGRLCLLWDGWGAGAAAGGGAPGGGALSTTKRQQQRAAQSAHRVMGRCSLARALPLHSGHTLLSSHLMLPVCRPAGWKSPRCRVCCNIFGVFAACVRVDGSRLC